MAPTSLATSCCNLNRAVAFKVITATLNPHISNACHHIGRQANVETVLAAMGLLRGMEHAFNVNFRLYRALVKKYDVPV